MDRLNLFNPFRSKPVHHEDHLTWVFLVALRYEPLLQGYLRSLVSRSLGTTLEGGAWMWGTAAVETQVSRLPPGSTHVVSVLLSDEPLRDVVPVSWSERQARYDAVIQYPDGMTVVIENKPSARDAWVGQLSLAAGSASEDDRPVLHDQAVSLTWPELLEGLMEFVSSGAGSFAGRQMVEDLLDFVAAERQSLNPYRTFAICRGREVPLRKRLSGLIDELSSCTGLEVGVRRGTRFLSRPGTIAQEAQLELHDGTEGHFFVSQSLWPADTVTQARQFFASVNREDFFELGDRGWDVTPNLHFAFMGTHLVWARTELDVRAYFDLFASGKEQARGAPVATVLADLDRWVDTGMVSEEDREEVGRHFLETRRDRVNVIPGFGVSRRWEVSELSAMENAGTLVSQLVQHFDDVLRTWGESMTCRGWTTS